MQTTSRKRTKVRSANPELLTTGQAAKICGVATRTIATWFDTGKFRGAYLVPGSKDRRIPIASLRQFLIENGMAASCNELERACINALIVTPDVPFFRAVMWGVPIGCNCHHAARLFDAGFVAADKSPSVVVIDDRVAASDCILHACANIVKFLPECKLMVCSESDPMKYSKVATVLVAQDPRSIAEAIASATGLSFSQESLS